MHDETENLRRNEVIKINLDPNSREALEAKYGQVWDTNEMREEFDVTGFMAPLVVVRRKSDQLVGSLKFQHDPRFYFEFEQD